MFYATNLYANQILHYTRCNTPKRTCDEFAEPISESLRPGNATLLKKWHNSNKPVRNVTARPTDRWYYLSNNCVFYYNVTLQRSDK